jgi:hypothetical protein
MPYLTWEELELSAYGAFRKTEAQHVQENYPHWVEQSANPDYERHLFDAYESSLVPNGMGATEPEWCGY